ncbi:MAG: hypothetical protein EA383_03060 [Spirochaetaceae bacterium]|nr:MAG: hypothetical protein EA383_03060 [Spirochaetaceae bacterium]
MRQYTLIILSFIFLFPLSLFALSGEESGGIRFVPDVQTVLRPNAFSGDPMEAEDRYVFGGFPSVLDDDEADRDLLTADGRRIGVYRILAERNGIVVGQLPRNETVPFAMVAENDEGPATLWLAELSYGTLYIERDGERVLLDLGYLYDWYIGATSGTGSTTTGFLPMAVENVRFDNAFGDSVLALSVQFLPGLERLYTHTSRATMLLNVERSSMLPIAVLIRELRYPDGFVYTARHRMRDEDGQFISRAGDDHTGSSQAAFIDEFALFMTPMGSSTRYRLQMRSFFRSDGPFQPTQSVTQLWQDTFPRLYTVGSEAAALHGAPGGSTRDVPALEADSRVRAIEAFHRIDEHTGASELWFRVQTAQNGDGWVRADELDSD